MTINELQTRLLEAYSVGNLNKISLTLINLFKTQQYSVLQKLPILLVISFQLILLTQERDFLSS